MQSIQDSKVLQTEAGQGQKGIITSTGREKVQGVPSNHTQAERKIIHLVQEGILEIDKMGRVWKTQVRKGRRKGGSHLVTIPRKRAESRSSAGYLQVRITPCAGARQIGALAHRLVWHYFHGLIPDGMCLNHINGIKDDNRPENLEIMTYSENMKHAYRIGTANQDGERNPAAKLSDAEVEEIRILYSMGDIYQVDLAKRYGVSFQTVSKIVRGERRSTQKGPTDSSDHRLGYMERDPKTGRFINIGKKAAGRLLDGREWNEMPGLQVKKEEEMRVIVK